MNGHALTLREILTGFTRERVKWRLRRRWNRPLSRPGSMLRPCGHTARAVCEHDIADRITIYLISRGHVTTALGEEARHLTQPPALWARLEGVALDVLPANAPSPDVFLLTAGLELSLPWLSLVTA